MWRAWYDEASADAVVKLQVTFFLSNSFLSKLRRFLSASDPGSDVSFQEDNDEQELDQSPTEKHGGNFTVNHLADET